MKNFTKMFVALALCVLGVTSVNAQEQSYTPVTTDMFHIWDGVGADANATDDAVTAVLALDEAVAPGGVIFGNPNGSVYYLEYADFTGYDKLVMEGTAGTIVRVMFNRVADEGNLTELKATFSSEGKAEVDLTQLDYAHLNCIKVAWGSGDVTMTSIQLAKEEKQEENPYTALTESMFHVWDGVGADAQQTTESPYFTMSLNTILEGGNVVYGNGNVSYLQYADLTGYDKLVMEGTAGLVLRVMFNRIEDNGSLTEIKATFDDEGKAEVDLTQLDYAHLNCIKVNWGASGQVTRLDLYKAPEEPVVDNRYTDLRMSMFHVWDGVGADAQQTSESPNCESNIGTTVNAGGTVFGNGSVKALQYADLTDYEKLVFKGDAGMKVRVLMNRVSDDGELVEIVQELDENGETSIDLTTYEYAHLNCIKLPWGSNSGIISSIQLFKDVETGVHNIRTDKQSSNIFFDLQGRRIAQPTKGLYIMNGKKVVVK